MPAQRRAISNQPAVAERIGETALAMWPPGHNMIAHGIRLGGGTRRDGLRNECVGIVAEHLNPGAGHPQSFRNVPAIVLGLAKEERGAGDCEADDRSKVPVLGLRGPGSTRPRRAVRWEPPA